MTVAIAACHPLTPTAPEAAPLRVLLVEDFAMNLVLMRCILTKEGHSVVVAENGREALRALALEDFDVVLMDVQMPEMNGLEATVAIREGETGTGRHVPIIALTAHTTPSDVEACLAAGMDAHLPKPVRSRGLFEVMHALVGRAPARVARAATAPRAAVERETLLASVDGDLELLGDLLRVFPREIPSQLAAVKSSVEGDPSSLSSAAHLLKEALDNFGAKPAAEIALRLARMGQTRDLGDAARVTAELERELRRVEDALSDIAAWAQKGARPGAGDAVAPPRRRSA
jgi:two-component system sensor histidine kinase/response regulator